MEPAAARRRPTDVVAAARPGRAARARAAASATAARGGRRRPCYFVSRRWRNSVPPARDGARLFVRLPDDLFVLTELWRLVLPPALFENGMWQHVADIRPFGNCVRRVLPIYLYLRQAAHRTSYRPPYHRGTILSRFAQRGRKKRRSIRPHTCKRSQERIMSHKLTACGGSTHS